MERVEVHHINNETNLYDIKINDTEVRGVTGIDIWMTAGDVPKVTLEAVFEPDLDVLGKVSFKYTPETVQEAARIIRHEIIFNTDFYKAYVASVESVLPDSPDSSITAERIVNRIFDLDD